MANKQIDEKINEIFEFAKLHDGIVSYMTVADILKNKDDSVDIAMLEEAMNTLQKLGIKIEPGIDDEDYVADGIEPDKFIPAEVRISQKPLNITNLMERLENGEFDLHPEFQRNDNIWTLEKQSRLIESLMLKIPIPAFYFDASDEEVWIVIDGLQRLSAFENFLVGRLVNGERVKEKFTGFQYLKDFDGFTFDDLPRQYSRRIKETSIVAYTVEKGTPDEVVYNIFQRINTGGVALEPQEIRQALYGGKATALIKQLAETKEFLAATQGAVKTQRMADREYVTRFIAFTELDYEKEYKGNIDNYLIKTLKSVNNYDESALERVKNSFIRVMRYCNLIFEKYAFRKYNKEWRRGPINKAIFEMWAVCFSELNDMQLDILCDRREEFLRKFQTLQENNEFISAIKSGDQYSTIRRIEMAKNLVREFV